VSAKFAWKEDVSLFTKIRRAFLYLLLTLSVLASTLVLFLLVNRAFILNSQGQLTSTCDAYGDLGTFPNGSGLVATVHDLTCTYGLAGSSDNYGYVYVHRVGEPDDGHSLVFGYDESYGNFESPHVVWSDDKDLRISINRVAEVTKALDSIDGIKISYSIGKEDYPRGESLREAEKFAAILGTALIFLTAIAMITARSIIRLKNKR